MMEVPYGQKFDKIKPKFDKIEKMILSNFE